MSHSCGSRTCIKLLLAAFALLAAALACGSPTKLVSINLHEEEILNILNAAIDSSGSDTFPFEPVSVEIQDGTVRVIGSYSAGGNEMPGSIDLTLSAAEGDLKAEISAIQLGDVQVEEEVVDRLNASLSDEIMTQGAGGRDQVVFESVAILDGTVQLVIRFLPPSQ